MNNKRFGKFYLILINFKLKVKKFNILSDVLNLNIKFSNRFIYL